MLFLGGTIAWAFYREWDWPQTVFIILHCLVLLMKQHSYAFYTGWLSNELLRVHRLEDELLSLPEDDDDGGGLKRMPSIDEDRLRLIQEIESAKRDLTGQVNHEMVYPDNLTYANFLDYMLCPTLVYELEYPRTDKYDSLNPSYHLLSFNSNLLLFVCFADMNIVANIMFVEFEYRIFWRKAQPH